MFRKPIGLLIPLASMLLAGCDGSGALSPFPRNLRELRLEVAERRWNQRRPGAYVITESRGCFCPEEIAAPMVVTVMLLYPIEGGEVHERVDAAHYESDGSPVPELYRFAALSVEQLFAVIRDAIDRHADHLDVEYDSEYGYPRTISIDYDRQAVDDEIVFHARDLQGMLVAVD